MRCIEVECIECGRTSSIPLSEEQEILWKSGAHIQNVAPNLSSGQRELLISRICGECFDEMFKEEDE